MKRNTNIGNKIQLVKCLVVEVAKTVEINMSVANIYSVFADIDAVIS